jgi:predicted alpha/beta-hydrolase family hydrolase
MLAAEDASIAEALLLLSYPLHLPGKPETLRTDHFSHLETPCFFVHGSRDAFGSLEEMGEALPLIPGRHALLAVSGGTHGLSGKGDPSAFADAFLAFVRE